MDIQLNLTFQRVRATTFVAYVLYLFAYLAMNMERHVVVICSGLWLLMLLLLLLTRFHTNQAKPSFFLRFLF